MAEPVEFTRIAPVFVVADLVRTAEHYRDVLGFAINGYFLDPPVYAIVSRGAADIHFGNAGAAGSSRSNDEIRKGSFDMYIWVSDIDGLYNEMIASGADVLEGPVRRVYGSTEVIVKDCNGLILAFGN